MDQEIYEDETLLEFLKNHRAEKGEEYTHTSINFPKGSYYINDNELSKFYKLYEKSVFVDKNKLYLTEKHKEISPILIDFDFRFKYDANIEIKRAYTKEHVENILKLYMKYLEKYFSLNTKNRHAFVLEKPKPIEQKGLIKDGIHIIFPFINSSPWAQYIIRSHVLKDIDNVLKDINLTNSYDDVIDNCVIERNNWQMYGSTKPNCDTYKISGIYEVYSDKINLVEDWKKVYPEKTLVKTLSIRNKDNETDILNSAKDEIDSYYLKIMEKKQKKVIQEGTLEKKKKTKKLNTCSNLELVENLIDLLNDDRAENYKKWIEVGWCAHNIDHRLLTKWIDFSKRSPKFTVGKCEELWENMDNEGLGIGSLHMWASNDKPEEYKKLIRKNLVEFIVKSLNGAHYDVAKVIYEMYKHQYVCTSITHRNWYEFSNHRWIEIDNGYTLRSKISNEVVNEYCGLMKFYTTKASELPDTDTRKDALLAKCKKISEITIKLRTTSYKDNIMKECTELFFINKFIDKLDSETYLIGFENGIYDLNRLEFRDGRPEDNVSLTTQINYYEFDKNDPLLIELKDFFGKVLTNEPVKEYVLTLLASFLNGYTAEERFHIWTGSGGNGKSKLIELFELAFGEYCCKLPITLLTQKRAASNAATSEIARAKGKRFACLQEPDEKENINVGLMKELTGGDKIQARAIYKEPIEFKPQFKMVLTCNHLPKIPSDDGGTWRRLRVVEFTSRFNDSPDPSDPRQFLIDPLLAVKLPTWKEALMYLLIEYYKIYKKNGLKEPKEVLACTKNYQVNNDIYAEFINENIIENDKSILKIEEIFNYFKQWYKESYTSGSCPSKKELKEYMERKYGKYDQINPRSNVKIRGWRGISIIPIVSDVAEEEDNLEV
jgi:P4 family phage/plasmid primase-like protien